MKTSILKIDREQASHWRAKTYQERRELLLKKNERNELYLRWRMFLLQQKQSTLYQQRHHNMLAPIDKITMAEQSRHQFWLIFDVDMHRVHVPSENDNDDDTASKCSVSTVPTEDLVDAQQTDTTGTTVRTEKAYQFAGMHNIFIGCNNGEGASKY